MTKDISGQIGDAQGNTRVESFAITPGSTANDVILGLGLQGEYAVSIFGDDGLTFGLHEPIYDKLENGAKLRISAPADVGV